MAREEALDARALKLEENKELVAQLRKEKEELERVKEKLKQEETQQKKETVSNIKVIQEGVKQAVEETVKKKQQIAIESAKERLEMKRLAEEQLRLERITQEDLIRQIRAMEKVPKGRIPKVIDPCETSNSGLLTEMSLSELKERLQLLKEEQEQLMKEKREEITNMKRLQGESLQEKAQFILSIQKQTHSVAVRKRSERRVEEEQRMQVEKELKDLAMVSVHEKLERKRMQRKLMKEKMSGNSSNTKPTTTTANSNTKSSITSPSQQQPTPLITNNNNNTTTNSNININTNTTNTTSNNNSNRNTTTKNDQLTKPPLKPSLKKPQSTSANTNTTPATTTNNTNTTNQITVTT